MVRSRMLKWPAALAIACLLVPGIGAEPQTGGGPDPHQLYVGACYQPVDRSPAEIDTDIARMKQAGFNVVRIGDLSWDAFEPREGEFTFTLFDSVMDKMQAAGIRVLFDIPGSIAPIWLHHAHPGMDIVDQSGNRLPPAERYMVDTSDPDYRRAVLRLTEALLKHYAHHPALMAVGYNNEIGNGYLSYSPAVRQRFIAWLQTRYGTLDALNQAWSTQRWSRHLNSFDEVDLPLADGPGPAERYLDLHRFWSDATVSLLADMDKVRQRITPDKPAISNLFDVARRRGFDYVGTYRHYSNFGALGIYPGGTVSTVLTALETKADSGKPLWYNEFTAGGGGFYGTPGRSRMWAYLGMLLSSQATLAWTFNSHLGGEEQALFGLIDHDNSPSWKLAEWSTIAHEFQKIRPLGFPRETHPQIGIAYSFASSIASHPNGPSSTTLQYFKYDYFDQVAGSFAPLFQANVDVEVMDLSYANLQRYKLVVIPADYVMDEGSATAVRRFVQAGGTAVMTALSAKVDEHARWFNTPLPGRLNDVFGVRVNAFYDTPHPLAYELDGKTHETDAKFYEVIEPTTAKPFAQFSGEGVAVETGASARPPAISINRFGKGQAVYVSMPSSASVMGPLLASLRASLRIEDGPKTPDGVYARKVGKGFLYVNSTTRDQDVLSTGTWHDALRGTTVDGNFRLEPYGVKVLVP